MPRSSVKEGFNPLSVVLDTTIDALNTQTDLSKLSSLAIHTAQQGPLLGANVADRTAYGIVRLAVNVNKQVLTGTLTVLLKQLSQQSYSHSHARSQILNSSESSSK